MTYQMPGRSICTATGEPRRVGYELEFSGIALDEAAKVIASSLGGEVNPETEAECRVCVPGLGEFMVELDWQWGKKLAREQVQKSRDDAAIAWLTDAASTIVPVEIVCPPIAVDQLDCLDGLVDALRNAGGVGTFDSFYFAFGVHLNPEIPDTRPETVVGYLKAFLLSQSWLQDRHQVDLSRRLAPYIDLFSDNYIQRVLGYSSATPMEQIIDDYLDHNPTRNRALDMTPLFRHIDEERLVARLDDDRINARPTFHYRLPNCNLEAPDWYLYQSWNLWCVVETLAENPALIKEMTQQWLARHDKLLNTDEPEWHAKLDDLHQNL